MQYIRLLNVASLEKAALLSDGRGDSISDQLY